MGSGDEFFMIVQSSGDELKEKASSEVAPCVKIMSMYWKGSSLNCHANKQITNTHTIADNNLTKITKSKFLLVPFFQFAVKTVQVADSDSSVSPIFLVFL